MTTSPAPRPQDVNLRLAALLREAGFSRKSFARALRQTSERIGWPIACDHTSVSRWMHGVAPRAETADLIVITLSQALGRRLTGKDAGISAPGTLADAPAGQRAVSVAIERDLEVMRRRLEWLVSETTQLARTLDALRNGPNPPDDQATTPVRKEPGTLYRRAAHRHATRAAYRTGQTGAAR
ncbi:hypothetical protein [Streptosporangium sp. NPDC020145]|uniref:hypothetical protein n=1 Tax=Streptosporangium sp. NPDC020145 TaxID=3154694 RepID=UPI003414CD5D